MTSPNNYSFFHHLIAFFATLLLANAADIYLEWNIALSNTNRPVPSSNQSVITINGMFPGPLINATTNDVIHVNVHNFLDEPLLFTWNGIEQRLNSWQDGVSGTNCPIMPHTNWTYVFQTKDQIGSFFYFPSINFQKAAGGYGPIRVNNRDVIAVPFAKPEAEFDLLIGDWFVEDYKKLRSVIGSAEGLFTILMNGKNPYGDPTSSDYASFTVIKGKTYRFRISNVGSAWSFNLRIQNHKMVLVETEGSYTDQITLDSLDVHVGQSYSILVTTNKKDADYYIMASPKMFPNSGVFGLGVLHYSNSKSNATGPLPDGPDPFDINFSVTQSRSIRWNLTAGAARPNPQSTFNVSKVTPTQTFILASSTAKISNVPRYVVNNVSYYTGDTPLKLADYFRNTSDVYRLDWFPVKSINHIASYGTSVVSGTHKGWIELVFKNNIDNVIDSWHLDGFGFYVVGFGFGDWTNKLRSTYNLVDPVVRSTTGVYPRGWTAVYAYLDNPGMWNLRSQRLQNWYLGQELYIRVHDDDLNLAKEQPPPNNLLQCGKFVNNSRSAQASQQGSTAHQLATLVPMSAFATWIGKFMPLVPSPVASPPKALTPLPTVPKPVNRIANEFNPRAALPPNAPSPTPVAIKWNHIGKQSNMEIQPWTRNLSPTPIAPTPLARRVTQISQATPWITSPPTPPSIATPPSAPSPTTVVVLGKHIAEKVNPTIEPSGKLSSPPIALPPNAPTPAPIVEHWIQIDKQLNPTIKPYIGNPSPTPAAPSPFSKSLTPVLETTHLIGNLGKPSSITLPPNAPSLVPSAERQSNNIRKLLNPTMEHWTRKLSPIPIALTLLTRSSVGLLPEVAPWIASPPTSSNAASPALEVAQEDQFAKIVNPMQKPWTRRLSPISSVGSLTSVLGATPIGLPPTPSSTAKPSNTPALAPVAAQWNQIDKQFNPTIEPWVVMPPTPSSTALPPNAPSLPPNAPSLSPVMGQWNQIAEDVNLIVEPWFGNLPPKFVATTPYTEVIAPVPAPAPWIGRRPAPQSIALLPNALAPMPTKASWDKIGTKEAQATKVAIGQKMSASANALTLVSSRTSVPSPTPSVQEARKSTENAMDYHYLPTNTPAPGPWVRNPNAQTLAPVEAPITTPTPVVAPIYASAWTSWWT